MNKINKLIKGICLCLVFALVAWFLGQVFPLIGGPVFGILLGMLCHNLVKDAKDYQVGIKFTAKKVLQAAVVLLGFGLNLNIILKTGAQSLPIILSTITVALALAYLMQKVLKLPLNLATLIGVGSSICGGSAIAATAPVIDADDQEVAQAISVIFLFNVIAALVFPSLGQALGFDTSSGQAFGIFAGTAVNDTSSVTATAATWDSLYHLGSQTLDKAVTVKLTRTLAIIPITLGLSFIQSKKNRTHDQRFSFKRAFPTFILYFILASLITSLFSSFGFNPSLFNPLKTLSKFMIVMAMVAIGLNTNLIQLIRKGIKPISLGFTCWLGITLVSLVMQKVMGLL
ncbi:YeiH family protein [Eremococcus coleocola]|uniref:Sulfate exporter family transporter n=1 Tax=Eremococcus coleocola ACS-139-V-Col8 TaxID=908337 RepID=E4KNS7_9LACT|nr:YeiH family protein [Eremococcus coleocola]EFR31092.1 hypothetical protein HMPREF9257_1208 [Eremococcus coleocola ACS-139-V-Col8]